ncbi:MAG: hypothetical protein RI883_1251 [Bacteroidota bacterium]|jgi:hypothetical protein
MSEILIITGLPRSGTSLMMQIIDKTEIPILSDGKREKDISNPEGYYELEAVKGIVRDNSFLDEALGKALKIVAPLPMFLNTKHKYRAIFMRREMEEILRSQEVMLQKDQESEREKFKTIYEGHLSKTYKFFETNNIPFIDINYNELVNTPEIEIEKLVTFCSFKNDPKELIQIVKPELYRNRK